MLGLRCRQVTRFETTQYLAMVTLTVIQQRDNDDTRFFITHLKSASYIVTGLIVLMLGLLRLAAHFRLEVGWLADNLLSCWNGWASFSCGLLLTAAANMGLAITHLLESVALVQTLSRAVVSLLFNVLCHRVRGLLSMSQIVARSLIWGVLGV